jgi:cation-transporting ATPase 13A2
MRAIVPDDYDEMLAYYTCKGYRVIGCATRHLRKMSWVKSQKMDRTAIERELHFTGFIIFENKLKHSTTAVLKELSQAKIGSIMVTGDNILTAVSVARDCGLVNPLAHCFIPRFTQGCRQGADARLEWESLDDPDFKLDNDSLLPLPQNPMLDTSLPYEMAKTRYYCLAVTGDIFRWIVDYAPPQTLRRVLVIGRVYARMSPDEKHELVEKLQSIGYCCGFCGDGANDCGALKAADVGISLSEAEASVAAPFTSRVFDISCVPRVIREGRAALATSFGCFKYMSLYSAIQFTTVSFLYASVSNLGDYQFMFIDIILILPIAIFMSSSAPYPTLSRKSPTANLVSRKVLVPLIGHMAICIAVQMAVFIAVRRQTWFIAPNPESDSPNIRNSENTTLFFVSCFEYVLAGMILNQGPPFRERWTKNVPFIATISIALIVNTYMVLGPAHWLLELMEITPISRGFSLFILGLGFVYVSISLFCEAKLFKEIVRYLGHIHRHIFGEKERKAYKLISEQMGLDTTYNLGR